MLPPFPPPPPENSLQLILPLRLRLKAQIFCRLGGESSRTLQGAGAPAAALQREDSTRAQGRGLLSPLIIAMITGVCFTFRHEGARTFSSGRCP